MKILIFNKPRFDQYMEYSMITDDNVETKDAMFISINSHFNGELLFGKKYVVQSYFKRQHSNVMIMHFGDYGEEWVSRSIVNGPTGLFNEYKAKKLYEFIKRNKNKSMAIIHCAAGISRSGAVGTFIHDLYGSVSWQEFFQKNSRISPNAYMLKLLHEQANKDIDNDK